MAGSSNGTFSSCMSLQANEAGGAAEHRLAHSCIEWIKNLLLCACRGVLLLCPHAVDPVVQLKITTYSQVHDELSRGECASSQAHRPIACSDAPDPNSERLQ
jgi:hypothetical protein